MTVALSGPANATDEVIYLKQGWSDQDRLQYYYTSQGTAVLPYEMFLNLEEASSTDLFRSDRVASSYGLFPQAADPTYNPDGLPVGVTKARPKCLTAAGTEGRNELRITCAACHTSQLNYKGAKIRIDGGAARVLTFLPLCAGLTMPCLQRLPTPKNSNA